jgi:hypothetical protein
MDRPLQIVSINGVETELLYTVSIYKILHDRKQQIVIGKGATWHEVTDAMLRMMYAAYLNAIEVRQIDEPTYNPERAKYMDFVVWSEQEPEAFAKQLKLCYKFITGQELELEKKKTTPTQTQAQMQTKTSIWKRIGRIFKIS